MNTAGAEPEVETAGLGGIVVLTPWYPMPSNRMAGSFVHTQAQLARDILGPVTVVHAQEWPGGRPPVVANLRPAYERLLQQAASRHAWPLPDVAGQLLRVPVMITEGQSFPERAEEALAAVGMAIPESQWESIRVVHGHVGYLGGFLASRLAPPEARVVVTEHSSALASVLADPRGREQYDEVLRRADALICVSAALRDTVVGTFPWHADKVRVIPNPVDVDAIPLSAAQHELKRWVYVGSLTESKGVDQLLRVFEAARLEHPELSLTLVGDGPLRESALELARRLPDESLNVRGALPHREALAEMARHDVLVHLSHGETFGLAPVEAAMAGLRVVVTRCGGPEETLGHLDGKGVAFVDVSDDDAAVVQAWASLASHSWDPLSNRDDLSSTFGRQAVLEHMKLVYGNPTAGEATFSPATPPTSPVTVIATSGWRGPDVHSNVAAAADHGASVRVVTGAEALLARYPVGVDPVLLGPEGVAGSPPDDSTVLVANCQSFTTVDDLLGRRPDLTLLFEYPAPVDEVHRTFGEGTAPHVVMIVGQDIASDARVRRVALAVAELPVRVSVVCFTPDPVGSVGRIGAVDVYRVPVGTAHKAARQKARAARRATRKAPRGLRSVRRLNSLYTRSQERGWKRWDTFWDARGWGARWRDVTPEFLDVEEAFLPVVQALQPDIIHAHDVNMMGIASKVSEEARNQGRVVPWIYDAHEWVVGLAQYPGRTPRVVAAMADHEAEYVRGAARVITVSPPLAGALKNRYKLQALPDVVLNVPDEPDHSVAPPVGVRALCGVDLDTPLIVYSGAIQTARGLQSMLDALQLLPDVHAAFVCTPSTQTWAAQRLAKDVEQAGLSSRVHFVEPVSPTQVTQYLQDCDLGLIPLLHYPSHEMALTNKLFEYLGAGLPVVVSDCQAQREFVEHWKVGVVHRAGDAESLASAVREALSVRAELKARIEESGVLEAHTWGRQAEVLKSTYRQLVPSLDAAQGLPSD